MRASNQMGLGMLVLAGLSLGVWQVAQLRSGDRPPGEKPAPIVVAPGAPRLVAEGRLETRPGAKVTVSSEVAGVLTNLLVQEKSAVQAGQLLAEIQSDDIYASLLEARARVVELDAEIRLAQSELRRGQALTQSEAMTSQELERLSERLETFEARRTTAQVTVKRLEITLGKARVSAPIRGVVLIRHLQPGEVVTGGTPIVTLVDLDRTWIEAEVDEYDIARLKPGAAARISAEGYREVWRGRVEEIPDRVTPRALPPQDPARPSDVRILPVKIALDERTPLKLGQRVEVEIPCE